MRRIDHAIAATITAAAACAIVLWATGCGGDDPVSSDDAWQEVIDERDKPEPEDAVHTATVDARLDRTRDKWIHVRSTFADWYYYLDLTNTGNQTYDRALILYRFRYKGEARKNSTGREVVNWKPGQTKQIQFGLRFSQKDNESGNEKATGLEFQYAQDIYHDRVVTPPEIEILFRPGSLWGPEHLAEGDVPIPTSVGRWKPGNLWD